MARHTFRPARPEDYDFLFTLHEATMRPAIEATWGWNGEWQEEYFRRKFDPERRQIIQLAGRDAGVLVVEDRPSELYLGLIEIAPEFQGHGIGTEIVRELQSRAATSHRPLTLHVLKANIGAHRLYLRLGFQQADDEGHRISMIWRPDQHQPRPPTESEDGRFQENHRESST
jgi:ribosomal protein S18 acetylase RimI-like enzyme